MPINRKVLRVFLASPGDLQDERRLIREVVVEFNDSWSDALGYHVELLGWEDTVSRFGRPQDLINEDVDRCDLFIGMIWKKWGTPPSHDNRFTSGFEEEFERSVARREKSQSPEISLFFTRIPDEIRADPGKDLQKVLEFRQDITARKNILYQEFADASAVVALARKSITAYVNRVRQADSQSQPIKTETPPSGATLRKTVPAESKNEFSPVSSEGVAFLESFVTAIRQKDALKQLGAPDIARFRLLANALSKPGNDDMNVGAHDINTLFVACHGGLRLGATELRALLRFGFRQMSSENVPLWSWYSMLADSSIETVYCSEFGTDAERVGAIRVLEALSAALPAYHREDIITRWLSKESPSGVRSAALNYLATNGLQGDYALIERECSDSKGGMSPDVLACMIRMHLRLGATREALRLVLQTKFESLDTHVLQTALEKFQDLDTPSLMTALQHRNTRVRLRALELLAQRQAIDRELAEQLCENDDVRVRLEAIKALEGLGKTSSEDDVKRILVRSEGQEPWGLRKQNEERLFKAYQRQSLMGVREAELTDRIEKNLVYDDEAYFVRAEKHFARHSKELRANVDDLFCEYFGQLFRRLEDLFGSSEHTGGWKNLEKFCRQWQTRRALGIICKKGNRADLERIKANLRSGFAGTSLLDVRYMRRYGDWQDISLLASASAPGAGMDAVDGHGDDWGSFEVEVAKVILRMSRGRDGWESVLLEIPAHIARAVIELCGDSRFLKMSRSVLIRLLDHESEDVRKAVAVKVVRTFSIGRVKALLKEYLAREHRYYNVVHWLDLGGSMPRREAQMVVRRMATG